MIDDPLCDQNVNGHDDIRSDGEEGNLQVNELPEGCQLSSEAVEKKNETKVEKISTKRRKKVKQSQAKVDQAFLQTINSFQRSLNSSQPTAAQKLVDDEDHLFCRSMVQLKRLKPEAKGLAWFQILQSLHNLEFHGQMSVRGSDHPFFQPAHISHDYDQEVFFSDPNMVTQSRYTYQKP